MKSLMSKFHQQLFTQFHVLFSISDSSGLTFRHSICQLPSSVRQLITRLGGGKPKLDKAESVWVTHSRHCS